MKVLKAVDRMDYRINVVVVGGPLNKDYERIKEQLRTFNMEIDLKREVHNMAEELSKVDMAITAGGGTLYEIAYMGVPGLAICLNDHQVKNAQYFEKEGVIISLGYAPKVTESMIKSALDELLRDEGKRASMSEKGRELIDGRGRMRVADIIRGLMS
jgi:spore coat polysaccharide biosynthesis predicted glycosyltransferase SpsG